MNIGTVTDTCWNVKKFFVLATGIYVLAVYYRKEKLGTFTGLLTNCQEANTTYNESLIGGKHEKSHPFGGF